MGKPLGLASRALLRPRGVFPPHRADSQAFPRIICPLVHPQLESHVLLKEAKADK